ncbi:hypothetical protein NQX30_05560 [Candidatus Persebacteraceae bacterium Df01]|uniref:Uncharacterized protein n=1 Tax=Candidatus Doriopsillibacter californiensis TaxID=2970740 RepID=A0ABT7QM90_9GAMM|nr:hypothetical protein [Candidatus Persebacteraceae bacterium Df01]
MQYAFPEHPLVISINHASQDKAYINLYPFNIVIPDIGKITLPGLFISDGMSIPDFAQMSIQGEDGIVAGHIHDMLYSHGFPARLAAEYPNAPTWTREQADQALLDYINQHCPGISKIESWIAQRAVQIFGERYFQAQKNDIWRRRIADNLGGISGNGCGVEYPQPLPGDVYKIRYGNRYRGQG